MQMFNIGQIFIIGYRGWAIDRIRLVLEYIHIGEAIQYKIFNIILNSNTYPCIFGLDKNATDNI